MTTSIPTTPNETGAISSPGNAGAGLAALFAALGKMTGGQSAGTAGNGVSSVQPADFFQLLKAPANAIKAQLPPASSVAASVTPLASRVTAAATSLSETTDASPADGTGASTAIQHAMLTRDDLEAMAALLATLLPALSAVQQALPTVPGEGEAETPTLPTSSTENQPVQISLKLAGMPTLAIQLPEGANESEVAAALETALADTQKPVSATAHSAALAENQPPAHAPAEQPGAGLIIELPAVLALGAATNTVAISLPVRPGLKIAAEKIAAKSDAKIPAAASEKLAAEKNFLSTRQESVKDGEEPAGIGVAESAHSMPAFNTVRRLPLDEPEFPSPGRSPVASAVLATTGAATTSPDTSSAPTTNHTSAPELAHRAVETVLNVVEFQQAHATSFGVVKLHFKFGSEDLAVRLQLNASGEVHTQFSTNSAELRAALSAEWQAGATQGGTSGLRLAEPVFTPASTANASSFGSSTAGQQFSSSQQHAQQQGQDPVPVWPELRTLRRGTSAAAASAVADSAPRHAAVSPNSLHLAAVA